MRSQNRSYHLVPNEARPPWGSFLLQDSGSHSGAASVALAVRSCPLADLRASFGVRGRSPAKVFGIRILWEFHFFFFFCHKRHLVVNLETKNGTSYLVKILKSKSVCFLWWVLLKMRGAGVAGRWGDRREPPERGPGRALSWVLQGVLLRTDPRGSPA